MSAPEVGRSRRLSLLLVGAMASCGVLLSASPAAAKLIPLEVQITDRERTVRVSPADAMAAINDGRARGRLGIFEYAPESPTATGRPLEIDLIVYSSRADRGRVHDTMGPDVVREKVVSLDYYRTESGAVGQVREGDASWFEVGRWVVFSPSFVDLVERARVAAPSVERLDPPLDRYEPHPASVDAGEARLSGLRALAMLGVVLVGLGALLLVRWSRRAVRSAATAWNAEATYVRDDSDMEPTARAVAGDDKESMR